MRGGFGCGVVGCPAGDLFGAGFVGCALFVGGLAGLDLGEGALGAGDRLGGLVRARHADLVGFDDRRFGLG
ncbi:hypothetical protein SAMN05192558_103317 [Actinokineospora alba]|uniref:Uncharacterized protein n=1 Tax=Actinokineospora alba TaxID=504798 RepID=A0A1H0K3N1_9PSEU|nr:hypothetical protein [Actinokineospora alba]TDP68065.1 hypothetical protein C8E96_3625 [Actinokineospora alba]SDH91745.1 hypothetical protein SAMN05421871_102732 [Actinokineospora alba]SDO50360.1 hypothetical protein SAMN05192558_103317 [Actinokineospora alba]